MAGLFMDNPFLASTDPLKGSMFLGVLGAPEGKRFVPCAGGSGRSGGMGR